jgi:hypothetical protein
MKADLLGIPLIGYLAFLLIGCSQIDTANASETPTHASAEAAAITETQTIATVPTQEDDMQTEEPSLPIPAIPGLQPLIEKAKVDLAQRLSIPASQINTVETREVFWPDASLGCPQPGTTYAQTEVSGYLIILEASGKQFEYHANIHNYVFYCENPTPPVQETPANSSP